METKEISSILTKEHQAYINKQIMKALKEIDWYDYVEDCVTKLFDEAMENENIIDMFNNMVQSVLLNMFVEKGLISLTQDTKQEEIMNEEKSIND